jgi:hypothetical protein
MDYERKTVPSIRRSPLPGYDLEYLCHLNTIGDWRLGLSSNAAALL